MTFVTFVAICDTIEFLSVWEDVAKRQHNADVTAPVALAVWLYTPIAREEAHVLLKYYASVNGTAINQFYCAQPFGDLHNLTILLLPRKGGIHRFSKFI
jgi:hypothetical protein